MTKGFTSTKSSNEKVALSSPLGGIKEKIWNILQNDKKIKNRFCKIFNDSGINKIKDANNLWTCLYKHLNKRCQESWQWLNSNWLKPRKYSWIWGKNTEQKKIQNELEILYKKQFLDEFKNGNFCLNQFCKILHFSKTDPQCSKALIYLDDWIKEIPQQNKIEKSYAGGIKNISNVATKHEVAHIIKYCVETLQSKKQVELRILNNADDEQCEENLSHMDNVVVINKIGGEDEKKSKIYLYYSHKYLGKITATASDTTSDISLEENQPSPKNFQPIYIIEITDIKELKIFQSMPNSSDCLIHDISPKNNQDNEVDNQNTTEAYETVLYYCAATAIVLNILNNYDNLLTRCENLMALRTTSNTLSSSSPRNNMPIDSSGSSISSLTTVDNMPDNIGMDILTKLSESKMHFASWKKFISTISDVSMEHINWINGEWHNKEQNTDREKAKLELIVLFANNKHILSQKVINSIDNYADKFKLEKADKKELLAHFELGALHSAICSYITECTKQLKTATNKNDIRNIQEELYSNIIKLITNHRASIMLKLTSYEINTTSSYNDTNSSSLTNSFLLSSQSYTPPSHTPPKNNGDTKINKLFSFFKSPPQNTPRQEEYQYLNEEPPPIKLPSTPRTPHNSYSDPNTQNQNEKTEKKRLEILARQQKLDLIFEKGDYDEVSTDNSFSDDSDPEKNNIK
jgi:hypothetical protein